MDNSSQDRVIPMTSVASGKLDSIAPDVHYMTIQIVNLCFVGLLGETSDWVLVDAGMPKSTHKIMEEAANLFGEGRPPRAIILTHGHFDHVGALEDLVERWNVPVYAHEFELPFLTGQQNYPEPDPSVEGGLLAKVSAIYPHEGIDLGNHVKPLPADGTVPEMPGWKWIHTPGHTPGHIALFRDEDRVLIAGDAFVTTKQESLYKVLVQEKEISGPPRYLTPDWQSAKQSVIKLEALKPAAAITGHGRPMAGTELSSNLEKLARDFDTIAKPDHGRYVKDKE
ncbi:MBL fold metallo-hydrolase [Bacillus sp. T33-2]|uniref:MBL fold metallo-hydrolase n=1 Tax=Bacillus sp. T33-2 TaxID=2054168 RepID=UPI000C78B766|nr:MBL fold metallo-hydrolase [Bacillus sp. T33-2]PLR99118.1 MBL fold metallo-hydrolase [Bacillus sp. T33-2]